MIDIRSNLSTAIYIRVSTEEQAREGFSINAQKEKLRQYAFSKDWHIYDIYIDDGISGKNIKDRPEIKRMLSDVQDGKVDNVLVYKIDRLTRSTKNLIELVEYFNENSCAFNSIMESIDTSSATGRMFIKIVGIFAEFERENLAERVSFGYEQKTREGNYTNTQGVYGYDYNQGVGTLTVNEYEKGIVQHIYQQYLNGMSMTKICKDLVIKQVPTKRGGTWSQSTVHSILTNPLYIGKVRYNVKSNKKDSFEAEAEHEHIINGETFSKVQEIMSHRQKYKMRGYPKENSYFLGSLFCAKCGAKLGSTQHKKANNKGLFINYYCYNRKNGSCDSSVMSHSKVEKAFLEYISQIKPFEPDSSILEQKEAKRTEIALHIAQLKKDLEKTEKRHIEIKTLFLNDKISLTEYREFIEALEEKRKMLINALSETEIIEEQAVDYEMIRDMIGNLKINWSNLSNEEKGQFLHQFISKIIISSSKKVVTISDCQFYDVKIKQKKLKTYKIC